HPPRRIPSDRNYPFRTRLWTAVHRLVFAAAGIDSDVVRRRMAAHSRDMGTRRGPHIHRRIPASAVPRRASLPPSSSTELRLGKRARDILRVDASSPAAVFGLLRVVGKSGSAD